MQNSTSNPLALPQEAAPTTAKTLRRLYLTLFLRGRGARGLQVNSSPTSIGRKLAGTLFFYALFGATALFLRLQSVFLLSAYLHATTFMFLGMFVASSAGEVLFNRDEDDILMHRPIATRSLLWAKVAVLAEVSIWLALAFNLVGLFLGAFAPDGHWWFLPVHVASVALQAFFCTGCVVLSYQLCLRWFGRERLEGMMTLAQITVSVGAVMLGQVMPQVLQYTTRGAAGGGGIVSWLMVLPPVWFAGIDDALAGSGAASSWVLAGLGVGATTMVLWLAFGKLVASFETGMQVMSESRGPRITSGGRRRWLDRMLDVPPLSWWLRDPRERASFLLAGAYLVRDRDVKLRIYPAVAPFLIMPVVFLMRDFGGGKSGPGEGFGAAFASGYSGIIPLMAVGLMQFSQHWQAADVFRLAPILGPALICRGARKAILLILVLPVVVLMIGIMQSLRPDLGRFLLTIPGLLLIPLLAIVPDLGGRGCPLSKPPDEAKSASRGSLMIGSMLGAMALSGLALFASSTGWIGWLIAGEAVVVTTLCIVLERRLSLTTWPPID